QSGDQNNIRVGANGEVAYIYSDFPSGWQDDRVGGLDISFETATRRRVVVNGVHAVGIAHSKPPITTDTFDLTSLPVEDPGTISKEWDHTINTVKNGDPLFALGI